MPLKVLVVGAGVCGPAFAALLHRANPSHEITIIERSDGLRQSGLQIDLRSQGIPIVRKMGLLPAIRRRVVPETGLAFVDARGRRYAAFGKNDSGQGPQGLTSEYEIMRGDLVDVFYRASLGLKQLGDDEDETPVRGGGGGGGSGGSTNNVRYEFGVTVKELSQNDDAGVDVTFDDGRKARYDLVVGADGQSSRTRRMLLGGKEASDACFRSLGLFTAFYQVPRTPDDDSWMKFYLLPGRRGLCTRSGDKAAPKQVYVVIQTGRGTNEYGLRTAMTQSVAEQKATFARAFADEHGWQVDSLMDALVNKTPDDDFYATEIGQVHCDKIAVGRIALLGDAGYTPSPITGMGTTLSLTGAYILAGELARHGENDVPGALQAYQRVVKPFVDEGQKLFPGAPGILYPRSRWGVWILTTIVSLVAKLRIYDFLVRVLPESKGGLQIPEYPELNLDA
ncbi:FAD/NAD(P)-binding domain-containing protein [Xylariaceae sp. FL1651]|nr:FAD/NAD(P)-binding domain-containing protein [Xylariaceae sp. FL1651]